MRNVLPLVVVVYLFIASAIILTSNAQIFLDCRRIQSCSVSTGTNSSQRADMVTLIPGASMLSHAIGELLLAFSDRASFENLLIKLTLSPYAPPGWLLPTPVLRARPVWADAY